MLFLVHHGTFQMPIAQGEASQASLSSSSDVQPIVRRFQGETWGNWSHLEPTHWRSLEPLFEDFEVLELFTLVARCIFSTVC
jgi:hypothetical protein